MNTTLENIKNQLDQLKVNYLATFSTIQICEISKNKLCKFNEFMSDFDNVETYYGAKEITIIIK